MASRQDCLAYLGGPSVPKLLSSFFCLFVQPAPDDISVAKQVLDRDIIAGRSLQQEQPDRGLAVFKPVKSLTDKAVMVNDLRAESTDGIPA